jgi:hypothetical protein
VQRTLARDEGLQLTKARPVVQNISRLEHYPLHDELRRVHGEREGRRMGSWALGRAGLGLAPVMRSCLTRFGLQWVSSWRHEQHCRPHLSLCKLQILVLTWDSRCDGGTSSCSSHRRPQLMMPGDGDHAAGAQQ